MKILICDDQAVIRDGLEMLLKLEQDFEIVGAAQDGAEAVELAAQKSPDLVLMDLKMPGMNGIEATRRIKHAAPQAQVVMLTILEDAEHQAGAHAAGAAAYLSKRQMHLELLPLLARLLSAAPAGEGGPP